MKYAYSLVIFASIFCANAVPAFAQGGGEIVKPRNYKPLTITPNGDLNDILTATMEGTINAFAAKNLKREEIAATLIDMTDASDLKSASFNGNMQLYTASVVKMFYMAALERQLEDGKVKTSPELERGLKDMIVDSSNDATGYILDVLTQTSSGAELPTKQFEAWQRKRNRVNRYFASMGYTNININQKTFCEDAYGIEQQSRKYKGANRNMLTTDATARLMAEIVSGNIATKMRTDRMMSLMKRDPFAKDPAGQAVEFIGKALMDENIRDAKLYAKAGWTSKSRHDAAYIELANGKKFVLVIFTENHAQEKNIIAGIAKVIINAVRGK
ncbi:MAG: serine hydrolase [Blastocatellia bacterium]|nr:serine hydrolase [Blastocatellia bacterium]